MSINYLEEENNEVNSSEPVENNGPTEEEILEKQKRERAAQALKAKYAFLGKWLWYYFLLIIPNVLAAIFKVFDVPSLVLIGDILSMAVSVATIVILYVLGDYDKNYRTSGLLRIAAFVIDLIGVIAFYGVDTPLWYYGIVLAAGLVSLYGMYLEFKTHAFVTSTVDPMLSANWTKLWKMYVIFMVAYLCSAFFALIPILGIIIVIAAAIGIIVCYILELIYLYRTAKLFQALSF